MGISRQDPKQTGPKAGRNHTAGKGESYLILQYSSDQEGLTETSESVENTHSKELFPLKVESQM